MNALRDAIDAGDWARALVLALDAWRTTRAPALADLVDRIARRCPTEEAPRHRVQPWWTTRAHTYNPITATTLCACVSHLAHKSDVTWEAVELANGASPLVQRMRRAAEHTFEIELQKSCPSRAVQEPYFRGTGYRNWVERLAILLTWPDDPRVSRLIAQAFADAKINWHWPHDGAALAFYDALAEHLIHLRDARVIRVLERVLAEPRGKTIGIRERQRQLAARAIDAIAAALVELPIIDDTEIATWCPAPPEEPARVDEIELWREAVDDDGARLVLADYLLARGDRRGEIITLASSGTIENVKRSSNLLHEHWDRWMGELALVLDRGHCTFTYGLLDIATIGIHSTPEWAFTKVALHRELASVRVVRPGWNTSERGYVAFLDALDELPPQIRVTATMTETLARTRGYWPVRVLELVLQPPLVTTILQLASIMPDVVELHFPAQSDFTVPLVVYIREQIRLVFPKLERLRIDAARHLPDDVRGALVELSQDGFTEVDHGNFRR